MKICKHCGRQFNDEMNYCPKCGIQLSVKSKGRFCPSCGKILGEAYEDFCPYCGYSFRGRKPGDKQKKLNSGVTETEKTGPSKSMILVLAVILCFGIGALLLFADNNTPFNGKQTSLAGTQKKAVSNKTSVIKSSKHSYWGLNDTEKSKIYKNLFFYDVLGKRLWLPLEVKVIKDNPSKNANNGIAFIADVDNRMSNDEDKRLNEFNVMIAFEKESELLKVKPEKEEEALNIAFNNSWKSMTSGTRVVTRFDLLNKEVFENLDGHKYLRAIFVSGTPNKPNLDVMHFLGLYIFDDVLYIVDLNTLNSAIINHDELFSLILESFGVNSLYYEK